MNFNRFTVAGSNVLKRLRLMTKSQPIRLAVLSISMITLGGINNSNHGICLADNNINISTNQKVINKSSKYLSGNFVADAVEIASPSVVNIRCKNMGMNNSNY